MIDDDAAELRAQLADALMADGSIRSGTWHDVFAVVPRHLFLPAFFRQTSDYAAWELVTAGSSEWLRLIYQDRTWVTQLDGDERKSAAAAVTEGSVTGTPSSSSTAPGLMALMLEALRLRGDERVLEIGTGTGYNAALLSERLGESRVTTIEVDPVIARQAETDLSRAGYAPKLVTGDGLAGFPHEAPYDRVIATCAAPAVPRAWIDKPAPVGSSSPTWRVTSAAECLCC